MPCPSQSSRFNHPDYIRWTVQTMKFFSCPFFFTMVVPNYQSSSEALCDVFEHPCFYSVSLLASRQTPKLEDHSWSAVHDCLFNIFAANLYIWRPTPPSATQWTRHAMVIGTHGWEFSNVIAYNNILVTFCYTIQKLKFLHLFHGKLFGKNDHFTSRIVFIWK